MWILYAFGSACFAGLTAVLAKCGIEHTNSHLATALRTIVVLIFSWIMVGIVGSFDTIHTITHKTFLFLILSGISTGVSWLCYFKALQQGNINKVTAVDKTSVVLTIILSLIFFKESVTVCKIIGMIILTTGTYLMVEKKEDAVLIDTASICRGGNAPLRAYQQSDAKFFFKLVHGTGKGRLRDKKLLSRLVERTVLHNLDKILKLLQPHAIFLPEFTYHPNQTGVRKPYNPCLCFKFHYFSNKKASASGIVSFVII